MAKVETESGKLAKKIEEVAKKIGNMKKEGKNTFSSYSYITHEQLNATLKILFGECKISILPEIIETKETESQNDKGKTVIRTTVKMSFEIIDHETGFSITKTFYGAEQDTGGKSMQQAITQCVKYFFFKLFRVSDKGDVDGDSKTQESKPIPAKKKFGVKEMVAMKDKFKAKLETGATGDMILSQMETSGKLDVDPEVAVVLTGLTIETYDTIPFFREKKKSVTTPDQLQS